MFTARWLQDALDGRQSFGIGFRLCGSRRLRRASTQPNLRASMIGWYISATQYGWRNQPQSQSADGPREIRRDQTEMRAAHGHVRRPNQPEVIASNMLTLAGIKLRVGNSKRAMVCCAWPLTHQKSKMVRAPCAAGIIALRVSSLSLTPAGVSTFEARC